MMQEIAISMITALAEPTAISFRLKVYSYIKFEGSQAEPPGPPRTDPRPKDPPL